MNQVHSNSNSIHIHYANQLNKDSLPFDNRKDAVIIGRGNESKNRFIFDLNTLNLFFLNFSPSPDILNIYRDSFSQEQIDKSIFSFIHAAHLQQLKHKLSGNVITWQGPSIPGTVTLNALPTCADWLGRMMKNHNIYLSGCDFDMKGRRFIAERDGLKIAMQRNGVRLNEPYNRKNKYIFITPNRYFHTYMEPAVVEQHKNMLQRKGGIIKELTS